MTLENNFNNPENLENKNEDRVVSQEDINKISAKVMPFRKVEEPKLEKIGNKIGKVVNMMTGAAIGKIFQKKPELFEGDYFNKLFQ